MTDANGKVISVTTRVVDPNNNSVLFDRYKANNGTSTRTVWTPTTFDTWTTGRRGRVISDKHKIYYEGAFSLNWRKDRRGRGHWESCAGDVCGSCDAFAQIMRDMLSAGGCASAKPSLACRGYSAANSCCGPEAFPVDPRVLMPNPNGNLKCMGQPDVDQEAACNLRCSVATSEEDCRSACSQRMVELEGSVLDRVCQEVLLEEACFSSGTLDLGLTPPPWVGPEPQPTPWLDPVLPRSSGKGVGP